MFAQLLYLVVIIPWAISLWRVILRASDWQIATWKRGNNRLTLKFISQTVHYVRSDVRWGEYFGTELYSMMSPSWELLCEMNFNLRVFTQRGEGGKQQPALSYLESERENYTPPLQRQIPNPTCFPFSLYKTNLSYFHPRHSNCCV